MHRVDYSWCNQDWHCTPHQLSCELLDCCTTSRVGLEWEVKGCCYRTWDSLKWLTYSLSWYTYQVASSCPLQVAKDSVGAQMPAYFDGGWVGHTLFPVVEAMLETASMMANANFDIGCRCSVLYWWLWERVMRVLKPLTVTWDIIEVVNERCTFLLLHPTRTQNGEEFWFDDIFSQSSRKWVVKHFYSIGYG